MNTAESHNLPLVGKIDLDAGYLRKPPTYETSDIERLVSRLQETTGSSLDRCDCDVCKMLQMWYVDSVAARRKAIRELQETHDRELIKKDD